jgi:replicative DNA helicase
MMKDLYFDIEAEKAVLGAILIEPDKVLFLLTEKKFVPEMFYDQKNQVIFRTIMSMRAKLQPIDVLTVQKRLMDKDNVCNAGGLDYLNSLLDSIPTAHHAEHYADAVVEKYRLRSLYLCLAEVPELIKSGISSEEITAKVMSEISSKVSINEGRNPVVLHNLSLEDARKAHDGEEKPGFDSFMLPLNDVFGGYIATNQYLIAGRPSDGKSTWAHNEVVHKAVFNKIPCAFLSLEMSERLLRDMMAGAIADVSVFNFRNGLYYDNQYDRMVKAYDMLANAPLYINDERMSIEQITSWLSFMIPKRGIKFVVLDYIQLIRQSRWNAHKSRNEQVADWSCQLKEIAKRFKVVNIILSQLSRAGNRTEDVTPAAPTLESLRDSGSLEQDADGVIFVYKKPHIEWVNFFSDNDWDVEVDVAKNRVGPIGKFPAKFVRRRQRFESLNDYESRSSGEQVSKSWNRELQFVTNNAKE